MSLQEILQPYQADKCQCEEYTNPKRSRELLERNCGKKSNVMKKPSGSRTIANKIQVWNGAQYLKRRSQRH
jgi:hypothetical protein